jgi:hypothetical protein
MKRLQAPCWLMRHLPFSLVTLRCLRLSTPSVLHFSRCGGKERGKEAVFRIPTRFIDDAIPCYYPFHTYSLFICSTGDGRMLT